MTQIFVRTGIHFADADAALQHIGAEMLAKGVVHASYPQALLEREAIFPTGIDLEHHAVAIPHCEALHAKTPAIYLIRPDKPVHFQRADDDGEIPVTLIIALIVENPQAQLELLKRLFSELQNPEVMERLLTAPPAQLGELFRNTLLEPQLSAAS
ncbi:PTS galactitol transporter subunit IIA [Buttiauxella selenatireducens]|uniref:PTS galactitol transporter subunit IIA n=1 Tax=Buttiauxella selenatireducens TaxID=3073902 RepID=A0ABY9S905_9ENTR|nr:PTS galactitol transporter subunit IIA [Buttiauxella sp. R73]WMY73873.1 PTS galactitol transporter subunit IIA [Buttiauxella sp. R73]